ncbi:MAG: ANTAR domain-containing protein [Oscillospiraceae bacterium]|nr:ANTAR domain-containing protein [Oscillospiraceae bacterium]
MIFQERTYAVLIVSASEQFDTQMRALLPGTDYYPVHSAASVGQAKRRLLETAYDLVLILTPLRDDFGSQLAVDVCADSSAGALLFVKNELFDGVSARVAEYGVMVQPMPTSSALVSQSLRMLCAQRERLRRMEARQQSVEEKIEEIRLVNKAKWLLIECRGMSEAEAQHYVEKQSMDRRVTKRQIAEIIIESYAKAIDKS